MQKRKTFKDILEYLAGGFLILIAGAIAISMLLGIMFVLGLPFVKRTTPDEYEQYSQIAKSIVEGSFSSAMVEVPNNIQVDISFPEKNSVVVIVEPKLFYKSGSITARASNGDLSIVPNDEEYFLDTIFIGLLILIPMALIFLLIFSLIEIFNDPFRKRKRAP